MNTRRERVRTMLVRTGAPLVLIAVIIAGPLVLSSANVDAGSLAALYLVAGLGLMVLMRTGQVSFGQGAFWAVGAYAVGDLTVKLHVPIILAIVLAVLITGVIAFLIGWPVTQLRGHYVAVATLALALIAVDLANNLHPITGGNVGLPGVPSLSLFGHDIIGDSFFRFCWIVALIAFVIISNLMRSRSGRALGAVGGDESESEALGIPSSSYRLRAFVLAGMFAGLGGAIYASFLGFLSPDAFTIQLSALILILVVVGGMGSPFGVVLGAIIVTALSQWLSGLSTNPALPARLSPALNILFYGAIIFLVMRVVPDGLLGLLHRAVGVLGSLWSRLRPVGARSPSIDPGPASDVSSGQPLESVSDGSAGARINDEAGH